MQVCYRLIDAARMHRENPGTFAVPPPDCLDRVRPGDTVKIGVRFDPAARFGDPPPAWEQWVCVVGLEAARSTDGERFWVNVVSQEEAAGGVSFRGTIDNDLVYRHCHGLDCGAEIRFSKLNILTIADWSSPAC
jgi:hypothetical protein